MRIGKAKKSGEWIIYWFSDPWTTSTAGDGHNIIEMAAWAIGSEGFIYKNSIMSTVMKDTYNDDLPVVMIGVAFEGPPDNLDTLKAKIAEIAAKEVLVVDSLTNGIEIPKGYVAIEPHELESLQAGE